MKLLDLYNGATVINKKLTISPKKCIVPFIKQFKDYKTKISVFALSNQEILENNITKKIYSDVLIQVILPNISLASYKMMICFTYKIGFGVKIYKCWYDIENQSYLVNTSKDIYMYNFDNIGYSKVATLINEEIPIINESKSFNTEDLKKIMGSWSIDCSQLTLSISKDKVKLAENLPIRCFKRIQKHYLLDTISIKEIRQDFSFLLIEDMKKDLYNIYEKSFLINTLLNENC